MKSNVKAEIDISVLLIFFNRPETFEKVFEQVRKARPSRLFLYQDGAREGNEKDVKGIKACREIVSRIDWECEVETFFQEKNVGCDPSIYNALKWVFSKTDKCVILEDDVVPAVSFIRFCKEMLDKYENDERIGMVCGMNKAGCSDDIEDDYLFAYTTDIWGWATWSRVVNSWETDFPVLFDENKSKKLYGSIKAKCGRGEADLTFKVMPKHYSSGKEYFESVMAYSNFVNNRLSIIPKRNMISNIGNTVAGGAHSSSSEKLLPKATRKLVSMKAYELESLPIKHPNYIFEDAEYGKIIRRISGRNNPLVMFSRRIESLLLAIIYRDKESLKRKFKKVFKIKK